MLTLIRGRANTGKSRIVLERIRQESACRQQILLVPDHASFAAEMDLCRYCGAAVSARSEVLTFSRLSRRVVAEAGGVEKMSLDNGGKVLMMQRAMHEAAGVLKVYRRPSQKVSFLRQFVDLVEEMERYCISPEKLMEYAQKNTGDYRDKLQDIAQIYAVYRRYVSVDGINLIDDMEKLCEKLMESGYVKGKDIYLDGFAHFTAQEYRAIGLMLSQAASVTVTLLGEKNNRLECFASGNASFDRLREMDGEVRTMELPPQADETALAHLERHFFGGEAAWEGEAACINICEATTLYNEVEQTAASIRKLVANGTYRYRDIGVAVRNMEDYEAAVENVFRRYEVPVYISRRSDLLDKPLMTVILAALDAVTGGLEYEDMFRYLKSGLSGVNDEACDVLENYVIKWDIRGNMWLRDTPWTANPDGYVEEMSEGQRKRLEKINQVREQVRLPLLHLSEGLKQQESARGKMEILYRFFEEIRLPHQLLGRTDELMKVGELQLSDEYRQLWELVCHVMDQFVEILGEQPLEREEFVRLLKLVISQYSVGTIPAALDQVSFDQISMNDRHRVKCLFLLGCNDHVLPSAAPQSGILTEEERERMEEDGDIHISPCGMDQMGLELQNIYAALARPQERLVISYPTVGTNAVQLRPAFIVTRVKKLFPSIMVEKEDADKGYRLTAPLPALGMIGKDDEGALRRYFEKSGDWEDVLAALDRGRSMRRGKLSPAAVESIYGQQLRMSASKIDKISSCHFAYFMRYGLRAKERKSAGLDPAQIGTFLHYVLEHVTKDVMTLGGFANVEKKTLKKLTKQHTDAYIATAIGNVDEREARFRYLLRRLRRTVDTVVENVAEEMSVSDFVPMAFELEFGGEGNLDAITIQEGNAKLIVEGKVDRVDGWMKDGRLYLRVVDYKTGRKSFDLTDIYHGINLQMLIYLFALERQEPTEFKTELTKEIVPAGVLYLPARDVILNMDRSSHPDAVRRAVEKELRRSGLLLHDREVLAAMEHEALTEPRYLPLALDKDHTITKGIASAEQLGKLSRYVDELLLQVMREINNGNIDADPCYYSEGENACTYCEFADACHFSGGNEEEQPRYIYPIRGEEFWNKISAVKKEGEEMSHG